MVLKCLGSSSKGNCYLLTAGDGSTLMIECGIPMREIKQGLNWTLMGVVACLVSHEHKDHSKAIQEVRQSGIMVMALAETLKARGIEPGSSFAKAVTPMQGVKVGGFKVLPFRVAHDVPCVGYMVQHPEMGTLVFVTDTMMLEYNFSKVQPEHLMIEANYCDSILQENIDCGRVLPSERQRLMKSHMEIKTTAGVVRANATERLQDVILLHLSDRNADADQFPKDIEKVAGRPVYVAKAGFQIELNKTPY